MAKIYIKVDLDNEQKATILKLAGFVIIDKITTTDLMNSRKKWIRFSQFALSDLIGELCYHFNRTKSERKFYFLDELICHLEHYEQQIKNQ